MRNLLKKLATPTFANSGSTARDHLASERTFLAWLRTGLGFIALGIAIERFSTLEPLIQRSILSAASQNEPAIPKDDRQCEQKKESLSLSLAFTFVGSGAIIYGTQRYLSNLRMLQSGLYRPAYWGIFFFVSGVTGLSGYGLWDTFLRRQKHIHTA